MNTNEKKTRIRFLKNNLLQNGPDSITDMEPTICQILKDIFGIGNEYTRKADKIHGGFIVPSALKYVNGQATQVQYHTEKFKMYMNLISQAEAYLELEVSLATNKDISEIVVSWQNITPSDRNHVFLSYCWSDATVANSIDSYLQEKGVEVTRDIRGVENWQSLHGFMETIRENDYAVLLISDNYLKSINCMYEVLEIMKESKYRMRIFPAVIESKIYSIYEWANYIKYWEDTAIKLRANLASLEYTNGLALGYELKKAEDISRSIASFLKDVVDMKNPPIDNINEAIYKKLTEQKV